MKSAAQGKGDQDQDKKPVAESEAQAQAGVSASTQRVGEQVPAPPPPPPQQQQLLQQQQPGVGPRPPRSLPRPVKAVTSGLSGSGLATLARVVGQTPSIDARLRQIPIVGQGSPTSGKAVMKAERGRAVRPSSPLQLRGAAPSSPTLLLAAGSPNSGRASGAPASAPGADRQQSYSQGPMFTTMQHISAGSSAAYPTQQIVFTPATSNAPAGTISMPPPPYIRNVAVQSSGSQWHVAMQNHLARLTQLVALHFGAASPQEEAYSLNDLCRASRELTMFLDSVALQHQQQHQQPPQHQHQQQQQQQLQALGHRHALLQQQQQQSATQPQQHPHVFAPSGVAVGRGAEGYPTAYPMPVPSPSVYTTKPAGPHVVSNPAMTSLCSELVFDQPQKQAASRKRQRPHYRMEQAGLQCRHCGVTHTPEWRRGPEGPKTLCNACGLHYAKALKRRRSSASGADASGSGGGSRGGSSTTPAASKGPAAGSSSTQTSPSSAPSPPTTSTSAASASGTAATTVVATAPAKQLISSASATVHVTRDKPDAGSVGIYKRQAKAPSPSVHAPSAAKAVSTAAASSSTASAPASANLPVGAPGSEASGDAHAGGNPSRSDGLPSPGDSAVPDS